MTYLKMKPGFQGARTFENYFEDFFRPNPNSIVGHLPNNITSRNFAPVNVSETKDKYSIELSAPGRTKSDFNININGNLLEISSEQKQEVKDENENYTRIEFKLSSFSRTFTLPETVNAEAISAEYTDGILKLTLPKKEEAKSQGPKKITIA